MHESPLLSRPYRLLCEMRTAELLVVSSLRLWVSARFGESHAPDWRDGFARGGMSSADTASFHALCDIVAATAPRNLDVRALHCACLGGGESWLLEWLGLLQWHRRAAAESVLCRVCPPSAVRLAIDPGQRFALALRSCGFWLATHHAEPRPSRIH